MPFSDLSLLGSVLMEYESLSTPSPIQCIMVGRAEPTQSPTNEVHPHVRPRNSLSKKHVCVWQDIPSYLGSDTGQGVLHSPLWAHYTAFMRNLQDIANMSLHLGGGLTAQFYVLLGDRLSYGIHYNILHWCTA